MIEFALSKLNLLIFVTAVAAIVVFFMGAVNSNMKIRQSYELVYRVGRELKIGIESNSYCTVKFIEIPKTIQTSSVGSDTFSIKYKLNVSVHNFTDQTIGSTKRKIVLAIIDRKQNKPKIYAAYDIDYEGNVELYESEYVDGQYDINLSDTNSVNFDPFKAYSIDRTILFIKKTENGIPKIYLIPCMKKNGIYQCSKFLNDNNFPEEIICLDSVHDLIRPPNQVQLPQNQAQSTN